VFDENKYTLYETLCQLDHYNSVTHGKLRFTQKRAAKYVRYKLLGTTPLAGA